MILSSPDLPRLEAKNLLSYEHEDEASEAI